jgi:hypothetical protein
MSSLYENKIDYRINSAINGATGVSVVKSSAGNLHGWYIFNSGSSNAYVRFFNSETGNSGGLEAEAAMTAVAPKSDGGTNLELSGGVRFSSGICYNVSTNPTTLVPPATNAVNVTLFYR